MGASQIAKLKLEQTTVSATVAVGLLAYANVSAWRPKKNYWDSNMMISKLTCAQFPA